MFAAVSILPPIEEGTHDRHQPRFTPQPAFHHRVLGDEDDPVQAPPSRECIETGDASAALAGLTSVAAACVVAEGLWRRLASSIM